MPNRNLQERVATAEERGALQAQLLREELAAVRLQLAAERDRRAAAEERAADATSRELRDLHAQVLTTALTSCAAKSVPQLGHDICDVMHIACGW